jgi:hypothetical protein
MLKTLFNGAVGYFLCWLGGALVFVHTGLRQGGSRSGSLVFTLIAAVIAVPCGMMGRAAIRTGKRFLKAIRVIKSVDQVVPFVVYLRSFEADGEYAAAEGSAGVGPVLTAEEDLALALEKIGKPVVAIGRPGEWLPELGADRYYVEGNDWLSVVRGLFARTKFAIIKTGGTAGLKWELAQCIRKLTPGQLVLWLPHAPGADLAHQNQRLARYRRFVAWASPLISGLPDALGDSQFIRFDAGWVPRVIPKYTLTAREFFLRVPTVIPSIFTQTSQHTKTRSELLAALGMPEPKPSLATFLLKGPFVIISSALLFVVVYLSIIALLLLVLFGIVTLLIHLFGGS